MSEDAKKIEGLLDLFTIKGFLWGFLSGVGFATFMFVFVWGIIQL